MGARIAVPAELEVSGPRILAISVALFAEITQLRNLLGPLASYWTGQASQGHEEVQQEWNDASTKLMTDVGTLGALSHVATTNWNNYVATEAANTASWRHGRG
jgi:uncharacterized protein YukE